MPFIAYGLLSTWLLTLGLKFNPENRFPPFENNVLNRSGASLANCSIPKIKQTVAIHFVNPDPAPLLASNIIFIKVGTC